MHPGDLNHSKVREFTREAAAALGVEPSFVDFVFAQPKPGCFDFRCEPTSGGWTCYVPDDVDAAYPLWSANADQTLLLATPDGIRYARGYHDEPAVDYVSKTAQGLLADLFIAMYEGDTAVSELRDGAAFSGFRFLDECLEFVDTHAADYENWDARKVDFIAGIDSRCI